MSTTPLVRPYEEAAAVIAGGTSGVGVATEKGLVEAGVPRIALVGRNRERGEAARQAVVDVRLDADVRFLSADAEDPSDVQRVVAEARDAFGSIDILVNSTSGTFKPQLLEDIALDEISGIVPA